MKPVRKFEHISGEGLLKYLKEQNLNIASVDYGNPPSILLNRFGVSNSVNLVVNMLLDDKDGVLSRQFAGRCQSYGENSPNKVDVLGKTFQKFVQEVLFTNTWAQKKSKSSSKNSPRSINENDQTQLDNFFRQIDHAVDYWAAKYEEILGWLEKYVGSLEQIFDHPIPASWELDDQIDEAELGIKLKEDADYIPNKYLDLLVRILDMFEAKVNSLERKMEVKEPEDAEFLSSKDELDRILQATIRIKNMKWDVFESYPFDTDISKRIHDVTHHINTVFDNNK